MSNQVGVVAFETELNSIVQEYLDFCDYSRTSQAFEDECIFRGKKLQKLSARRANQKNMEIRNEMLEHVRKGNRKLFFESWERNIPRDLRNSDMVAKKLEFYLHMYFAVFPLKYGTEYQMHAEENMAAFKKYLETRGSVLSQTTEFLPYYALPFVQNPKTHPTYRELFGDLWMQEIQIRLEKFLTLTLDAIEQPRLFELYRTASGQGGQEYITKINCLEQKLYDSEKKAAHYIRRHNKVQTDYHNLIGITAELVDALESTMQGKKITQEFLQDIMARMFSRQNMNALIEWDLSRPGTAGAAVRQATARSQKKASPPELDIDSYPPNLDYAKIKIDLINADNRKRALILQALRWRLSRCPPGDHQAVIIRAMLESDILGCTHDGAFRQEVISMLRSKDELLQPSMARLLNSISSFLVGRKYLNQNSDLINAMIDVLKTGDKNDPSFLITADHLLATLQKLSLRRSIQSKVIEQGLVEWLVDRLEDLPSISDYSLEYSIALLMNLCLRSAGKLVCVPLAAKAIKALSGLLGHRNREIVPYVNGAVYSLLSVPAIRAEAKKMKFEETLRSLMKDGSPDNNRQLEYIIRQLNSTEQKDIEESDDEDADEEYDDEEQDGIEADIDKDDLVKSETEELNGERLLLTEYYTAPRASAMRSATSRPHTGEQRNSNRTGANVLTLEDVAQTRAASPSARSSRIPATTNAGVSANSQNSTTARNANETARKTSVSNSNQKAAEVDSRPGTEKRASDSLQKGTKAQDAKTGRTDGAAETKRTARNTSPNKSGRKGGTEVRQDSATEAPPYPLV